jgi:FK506-binding protein 1
VRGYYIKNSKKKKKKVEFEDTRHSGKPCRFKIGANQTIQGLETSVLDMQLGEEATITMTPDVGFDDKPHQGYLALVPANSDLVLEVRLMKIFRHGKEHRRKRPKDNSSLILKAVHCYFRHGPIG